MSPRRLGTVLQVEVPDCVEGGALPVRGCRLTGESGSKPTEKSHKRTAFHAVTIVTAASKVLNASSAPLKCLSASAVIHLPKPRFVPTVVGFTFVPVRRRQVDIENRLIRAVRGTSPRSRTTSESVHISGHYCPPHRATVQ